jgi:hypothetical protein
MPKVITHTSPHPGGGGGKKGKKGGGKERKKERRTPEAVYLLNHCIQGTSFQSMKLMIINSMLGFSKNGISAS